MLSNGSKKDDSVRQRAPDAVTDGPRGIDQTVVGRWAQAPAADLSATIGLDERAGNDEAGIASRPQALGLLARPAVPSAVVNGAASEAVVRQEPDVKRAAASPSIGAVLPTPAATSDSHTVETDVVGAALRGDGLDSNFEPPVSGTGSMQPFATAAPPAAENMHEPVEASAPSHADAVRFAISVLAGAVPGLSSPAAAARSVPAALASSPAAPATHAAHATAGFRTDELVPGEAKAGPSALPSQLTFLQMSQEYALRQMHIYRGNEGVQAWIRDATLNQLQANVIAQAMSDQLNSSGSKLSAMSVNGRVISVLSSYAAQAADGRADEFIQGEAVPPRALPEPAIYPINVKGGT